MIALTLSGLPRITTETAISWWRIIEKYNPDIFIHTWENAGKIAQIFPQAKIKVDPLPEIDTSMFPDRHWPSINVFNSLCMWRSVTEAFNMLDREYDTIVRGRLDWYVEDLTLFNFDGIVIPWDSDKLILKFTYIDTNLCGYNDHFAYGPPNHMQKYVETANQILPLYRDEGVDYCPENFLAASLHKQKARTIFQKINHRLIRG